LSEVPFQAASLSLAPSGVDGLSPLFFFQCLAVWQLAEMLLDEIELRGVRPPGQFASLLDDTLVILADESPLVWGDSH
jgi:hypothetical protein